MQYTMNTAWVVSDSYIASYLFPYFLCRSLLPFLNTKFFKTLHLTVTLMSTLHINKCMEMHMGLMSQVRYSS